MSYERENIRLMSGYLPGEQPDDPKIIKLNTNENPYPPSSNVSKALSHFDIGELRRYPPPAASAFRELAARKLGVKPNEVLVTNGGDEALRLAVTTFVDPGATFAMATPSYSLYEVLAQVQDCKIEAIPLRENWTLPNNFAKRVNKARSQLTCIVNPHAPSGFLLSIEDLSELAAEIEGVLLIDEAYVDFVDPTLDHRSTELVHAFDNVLLLRSLSKGYSLAGLRFGFLLGNSQLLQPIATKTRDSYNKDSLGQHLACAAFEDDDYAHATWELVRRSRQDLREALVALGFQVPVSQTNFLLAGVPVTSPLDALEIFEGLKAQNILVRHFSTPRLTRGLRITVGTPTENDALLTALHGLLGTKNVNKS